MSSNQCYLSEVYSAIQGEGPLVGVRQIFVRFSACDLRCIWCDTPDSLVRQEFCEMEDIAGSRSSQKIKNPITLSQLISYIKQLEPAIHHSISLTGGEPLLQSNFLVSFLPTIKKEVNLPIYLESGGHRPSELKSIVQYLDYISMDFKLPSSSKTSDMWDKHYDFLSLSLEANKQVWVKIVLTNLTLYEELLRSLDVVKSVNKKNNKKTEIFLQPVTQINGSKPPSEAQLLNIQSKLLCVYPRIRVVPQVHRLIGQK